MKRGANTFQLHLLIRPQEQNVEMLVPSKDLRKTRSDSLYQQLVIRCVKAESHMNSVRVLHPRKIRALHFRNGAQLNHERRLKKTLGFSILLADEPNRILDMSLSLASVLTPKHSGLLFAG